MSSNDSEPPQEQNRRKQLVDAVVVPLVRRSVWLQGITRRVVSHVPGIVPSQRTADYARLRECFLKNGANSDYDQTTRLRIVERFEAIDRHVRAGSSPTDGLHLAEAALSLEAAGDFVECGCFQGASTAKLSVLASVTGRRLIAFDSFEGLPDSDDYNRHDLNVRLPRSWMNPWEQGAWAGSLQTVKENVGRWGEVEASTFVKGWFSETLTAANLPREIALAFTDVDLPSSARECLIGIWPRLATRGIYFSHDVAFIKVLNELTDEQLWRDVFKEPVPVVFGAGYGLGDSSRMLGFMLRSRSCPPEYIKRLSLDK